MKIITPKMKKKIALICILVAVLIGQALVKNTNFGFYVGVNAEKISGESLGQEGFFSAGGLFYGADPSYKFDTRLDHVMAHTRDNPLKKRHTIFLVKTEKEMMNLLDEAWGIRGPPIRQGLGDGSRDIYVVNMKRKIGTRGEPKIKIIIENKVEVISAYPVF